MTLLSFMVSQNQDKAYLRTITLQRYSLQYFCENNNRKHCLTSNEAFLFSIIIFNFFAKNIKMQASKNHMYRTSLYTSEKTKEQN